MKIRITFKTPDVLDDEDITPEMKDKLRADWIQYGEYIVVEFDDEDNSMKVIKNANR